MIGGLGQVVAHRLQALGVFDYFANQLIQGVEEAVKALADLAFSIAAVAQVNGVVIFGELLGGLHQGGPLHGFGMGLQGQVNQDRAFQHHVERMQEDDRPAALCHHCDAEPLGLQGIEAQVVNCNHGSRHHDRQPVAVIHQKRQQHENTEVHFQHAARLVDVQCGHHHKRRTNRTAQQTAPGNQLLQYGHHRRCSTAHQQGLAPSTVPERQTQRVKKHQPQHHQHDAVRFTVVQL